MSLFDEIALSYESAVVNEGSLTWELQIVKEVIVKQWLETPSEKEQNSCDTKSNLWNN